MIPFGIMITAIRRLAGAKSGEKTVNPRSELIEKTAKTLHEAKKRSEKAKKFIEDAKIRKKGGHLTHGTYSAEIAAAHVIATLHPTLDGMYEEAKKAKHSSKGTYPFHCINSAASRLVCMFDSDFVTECNYPKHDPAHMENVVRARAVRARGVYDEVVEALDGVHEQLGIEVPPFLLH